MSSASACARARCSTRSLPRRFARRHRIRLSLLASRRSFLSNRYVYHIHDRAPPEELREFPPPPAATTQKDYRARRFPGGGKFKTDTPIVPAGSVDDYRIIYIYKDPVEAMVSRFGHGHCKHIQGDCGESDRAFPKLDAYAAAGVDRMRLIDHFDAYTAPNARDGGGGGGGRAARTRNYPIIALNYHKLWDNLDAVMHALSFPPEWANKFPKRTETVRNDLTGAAEKNSAHTEATRDGLRRMYAPILTRQHEMPAVSVI